MTTPPTPPPAEPTPPQSPWQAQSDYTVPQGPYPPAQAGGPVPPGHYPPHPAGQYPPGQYPPPGPYPGQIPPGYGYPPAPPPVSPSGQRLAEFTDRLLARLIDGLIVTAISMVFIIPVYVLMFVTMFNAMELPAPTDPYGTPYSASPPLADPLAFFLAFFGLFALVLVLALALSYLYEVELLLRGGGQTPGKKAMKIKVIPLDPAQPLTRKLAAQRFLIYFAAGLVPAGNLIDGLWQLWDKPYRQCLHDKWPRTTVIKLSS